MNAPRPRHPEPHPGDHPPTVVGMPRDTPHDPTHHTRPHKPYVRCGTRVGILTTDPDRRAGWLVSLATVAGPCVADAADQLAGIAGTVDDSFATTINHS